MLTWFETTFSPYAHNLSIELFAFIASFIEEIIPPIPGPAIMMMAGSFAQIQDYTLYSLFALALFASVGKTLGAIIVYHLVDRVENVLVGRFGKYFGIKPGDLEDFGKKLGHGTRDYVVLTMLRSLPFVPSSLISVGCGLLKVPFRLFLIATILGTLVRDSIFLYIGFVGTSVLQTYLAHTESVGTVLKYIAVAGIVGGLSYLYLREQRRSKIKTTPPGGDA